MLGPERFVYPPNAPPFERAAACDAAVGLPRGDDEPVGPGAADGDAPTRRPATPGPRRSSPAEPGGSSANFTTPALPHSAVMRASAPTAIAGSIAVPERLFETFWLAPGFNVPPAPAS